MIARTPKHVLVASIVLAILHTGCATEPEPLAASTSPCKPWVNYPSDSHGNQGSPYLGCTNSADLNAMVVDKNDLAKGRSLAPADGQRQSDAVKAYQSGQVKTGTNSSVSGFGLLLPQKTSTGTTP